jgi:hypothetical protein
MFCPSCGLCFLDVEKSEKAGRKHYVVIEKEKRMLAAALIAVILTLAIVAGVTSYLLMREIQRSALIIVKSGAVWRCTVCGKIYKDRVITLEIEKGKQDQYSVETVDGICNRCKYGAQVGLFDDYLKVLSKSRVFHNIPVEIDNPAVTFIAGNGTLFPAASPDIITPVAVNVSPGKVVHDFKNFEGKPLQIYCTVLSSEVFKAGDGSKISVIRTRSVNGEKRTSPDYVILYPGEMKLEKGAMVNCYLLPIKVLHFKTARGAASEIVAMGMFLDPVEKR